MGQQKSKSKVVAQNKPTFKKITDNYATYEELQVALRTQGLESSNLIVFFDFTKSNTWQGQKTFSGQCLHKISEGYNPYQYATYIIGRTLEVFDDDKLIPAFGFGDYYTRSNAVFPFYKDGRSCKGFEEVLHRYSTVAKYVNLCGPTSFAPAVYKAIDIVRETKSYHIAIIIADGVIDDEAMKRDTINAIVEASKYPLSIIMVGVGDGPWDLMNKFDDELPERTFDNFQFVNFNDIINMSKLDTVTTGTELNFAHKALMEVPEQFQTIKKLGLNKNVTCQYHSKSMTVALDIPELEIVAPPAYEAEPGGA